MSLTGIQIQCPACRMPLDSQKNKVGTDDIACSACGKVMTAYEAGMAEVRAYIRQMRLMDAIKAYRKTTGADLGISKDAVAEMWHSGDW